MSLKFLQTARNYQGYWPTTLGRILGLGLIMFYQNSFSFFIGNHCRHLPTCSEYGYEAIARYGLWTGGFLTFFRLIRCLPGGSHGFDPVPKRLPLKARWFMPWRYWQISYENYKKNSSKREKKC